MKLVKISRITVMALVVALLAVTASIARDIAAEGSFDKTLKVNGAVDLTVSTGSGSISVHNGDAATVRVSAKIRVSEGWHVSDSEAKEKVRKLEANPPIEQEGNTIRIGEIKDEELRRNVSISYEIVTPAETRLRASSGSGSETIEGVRGPVDLSTGSGSIHVIHIGSELHATTGSGTINADGVQGTMHATTGSGGIHALGVAGGLTGQTGSGSIELEQTAAGDVDVQTGSGGITLRGVKGRLHARAGSGSILAEGVPSSEWRLHTGSGGVTLRLPADAGFELEANTGSGSVSTTHEITVVGVVGNRHELRGKSHGGGPLISASTSSGSIRIE
jgi:DUF4097 and DUF4098 domain-containing protein YvlB